MKPTDKDQPIHTIPKGVWDSSIPNEKKIAPKNRISMILPLTSKETDTQYLIKPRTIKAS